MLSLEKCFIGGVSPKSYIYRTITFDRLKEIFEIEKNTLVRPCCWEDPYEDILGNAEIISKLKRGMHFDSGKIYGQCWTMHTASDAIWRIYSNGKDGFRIRTTAEKLLSSLRKKEDREGVRAFFGKVRYLDSDQLREFGRTHFLKRPISIGRSIAEAYMVKRKPFEHEKEARLIFVSSNVSSDDPLFRYNIDPNDLIDQIMIHPRIEGAEAERIKDSIRNLGFLNRIEESTIYRKPAGFEFHFPG